MTNGWFCMALLLIFFAYILTGCDYTTIEGKIVYEDMQPARALVTTTCDTYVGATLTDSEGKFTLYVPPDTALNLCAEEYSRGIGKTCYDGELLSPSLDSNSTDLIEV